MNNYAPALVIGLSLILAADLIDIKVTINITDKPIITSAAKSVTVDINQPMKTKNTTEE